MRIFLLVFLNLLMVSVFAQAPTGGARGGSQNMNMGRFYGKVVDSKNNKPVDAASVQLVQSKFDTVSKKRVDQVISGQLTKANGDFSLENLPVMAQFKLRISAIGYISYEEPVKFDLKPGGDMSQMMNMVDRDLGNLKLAPDIKSLAEVTVVATKPFMQMGVDRRIFNVEKNMVSAGQTATELMRNIPGLNVDIDGNVTLRNAAPTIFIDGRPTTLTLDQIPADAIESVEMITNPSAKFDASGGMAGILNIVLKKNRKAGYNGNVRAGIDSRAKVNLGGDINVKQEKVNVFLSAMFNQRKSIGEGESIRTEKYTTPNVLINQVNNPINKGYFMFLRGGFDYLLDNRNTITLSGNYVKGSFDNSDLFKINTDSVDNLINSDLSTRTTTNEFFFRNINSALGYKRLFKKTGRELTADINYSRAKNGSEGLFVNQYYDDSYNPKGIPIQQSTQGQGTNNFFTTQSDFVTPLSEKMKLEAGVRAAIREVQSENLNYIQNPVTGDLVPVAAINANYKYNDVVLAAYSTLSGKIGKNFTYLGGLRMESSKYDGTLLTNDSSFSNSFPLSFFPSLFLTQKLNNNADLQLSYSRRINRPNFFQLLPFIDYSDSLNISRGNPNLVPEFTNSFELSYSKNFKNSHSLLFSGWLKLTDNLITRAQVKEPSSVPGRDVIINTYINADNSRAYGFEVVSKNPLAKWLDVTTNLNVYNSKINNTVDTTFDQDALWSFFAKMNLAFKLPKNFTIQLSGDYQSKTILPQGGRGGGGGGMGGRGGGGFGGFTQTTSQGYNNPNYAVDFAIRKEFMKDKKASLALSVNDIFKTRRSSVHSESEFFVQDYTRRQDWRLVRLNFNYRFGKFDMSLFKRKNTRSGADGVQEGMQMQ